VSGCGTTPTKSTQPSGTATPIPHQVDLSWDPPGNSPVEVIGYNIYRSIDGTSTYQRLNFSVDAETVYLDSTVQSGLSYDYFVKSVDPAGIESDPSNTIKVTIP